MRDRDEEEHSHPRLCDRCQPWRRWKPLPSPPIYYLTYDHLYANSHCLICMHVFPAANNSIPDSLRQSIPPSRLVVRIAGPIKHFTRIKDWEQAQDKRIEENLPLGIWVRLDVSIQPESAATTIKTDQDFERLRMTPVVSLTPRLRAYCTHDGTLSNVEIGDVPYFDISTLNSWLRSCKGGHGAQCMDRVASKGSCSESLDFVGLK